MRSPQFQEQRRHCVVAISLLALGAGFPGIAAADAFVEYFRAVKMDNVRALRSLLARGLGTRLIEPDRGDTGLILALREESMDVFSLLLEQPDIDIHARAFNGDTALMIASFKGNKPAVEMLLARGAQAHHSGWTPLHYAAAGGHTEIARILLERKVPLDPRSPNNTTPMMMAAGGGHIMTVKLLLDEGADATLRNNNGMSPIDFALQGGHTDIVEGLTWRLKRAGKL